MYNVFSILIIVVVLTYTWILAAVTPRWFVAVPTVLVVGLTLTHAVKTREWGLHAWMFAPALAWSTVLTAFGALVLTSAGSQFGTWHELSDPWHTFLALIPWGLGQQFALQTVFLRDAQAVTSKRRGIWLAALMFGALHLPNPFLTLATGIAASTWCWIYDRYPNVVPLALSHAVLTLSTLSALDDTITGRLRVGAAYLSLR